MKDASKTSRPKTEEDSKMQEFIASSVNEVVSVCENGNKLVRNWYELSTSVFIQKKKRKFYIIFIKNKKVLQNV